jgi:hypothetical protein
MACSAVRCMTAVRSADRAGECPLPQQRSALVQNVPPMPTQVLPHVESGPMAIR